MIKRRVTLRLHFLINLPEIPFKFIIFFILAEIFRVGFEETFVNIA
jgi:hypothetical protein